MNLDNHKNNGLHGLGTFSNLPLEGEEKQVGTLENSNIIINADDFGMKASVNLAIIKCFECHFINSTSIMANMEGFDEAIRLSKQSGIGGKIGVHLGLTEGVPLNPSSNKLPFLFKGKARFREKMLRSGFRISKKEIEIIKTELRFQIEKVLSNNLSIHHIDSHHHIHEYMQINNLTISLAREYGVKRIRILNNMEPGKKFYKQLYRTLINIRLINYKLNNSRIFGSQLDFAYQLAKHPRKSYNHSFEIMVHPEINVFGDLVDRINNEEYTFDFLKLLKAK